MNGIVAWVAGVFKLEGATIRTNGAREMLEKPQQNSLRVTLATMEKYLLTVWGSSNTSRRFMLACLAPFVSV